MTSKKIIERLQKGDWCIFVSTYHEVALVLNACIDSNIKWFNDIKASDLPIEFYLDEFIGCSYGMNILTHDSEYVFSENITDWFFSEINKGDGIEREHLHNILDAWLDGNLIECKHKTYPNATWNIFSEDLETIEFDKGYEYRIKPKQTPLPIPVELWKLIDKSFSQAITDEDLKTIRFYSNAKLSKCDIGNKNGYWTSDNLADYFEINACDFNINIDGIDWRLSLTKRPEGV